MDNKVKICIAIVIIAILLVICVISFKNSSVEESNNEDEINVVNEIDEEDEVLDEEIDDEVTNKVTSQATSDGSKLSTQDFTASVYEDKTDAGTLSKKQEAIELVKTDWNKWGEDNSVTFSVDSITNDGIYIVAVTSKERAEVLRYYRVNLTTKVATPDY